MKNDKSWVRWRPLISIITALFILISLCVMACSSESPSLKILVVHSYHEGWGWNQDIQKGIIEGLSRQGHIEGQDYQIKTFYMDTKVTYITPEQVEERGPKVRLAADEYALADEELTLDEINRIEDPTIRRKLLNQWTREQSKETRTRKKRNISLNIEEDLEQDAWEVEMHHEYE